MKTMDADSIDSIVTDPPYELGFMGKSWDSSGIAFNVEVWQEALRVLKPGGHLIAFSGSRTYHRMAVAIEDAGFEIRDQIMWVYGSGFPKSHDVSKAIDKRGGATANFQEFRDAVKKAMKEQGLKTSALADALGNFMLSHYLTAGSQPAIPNYRDFKIIRDFVNLGTSFDHLFADEAEREVVGSKTAGMGSGKTFGMLQSEGFNSKANQEIDITAPATAEAKQWQGWGTALKPAHEPMVLARKPLIGTVANNVLTFGVGGLNIDGSRVGRADGDDSSAGNRTATFGTQDTASGGDGSGGWEQNTAGRFPANFIHDGSDEVVELLGEPARFFYCAKASKKDRNEGLDGFESIQTLGGGGLTAEIKEDGSYETASAGGKYGSIKAKAQNHHPTVKPTSLMQYLVRLVTPPNGIVLDPFLGSGSTGKAAMYEGFNFVGIELTPEYLPIAKARIEFALKDKEGELDFEPR